jgi:hypothetical protein
VDTADGALEITKDGKVWRGSWLPGGPLIKIPGARDLQVHECAVGGIRPRQKLGVRYVLISRELAERLPTLRIWCRDRAESSIRDPEAFWLPESTWMVDRHDRLPIPFIPEYDETGDDLRRVAATERRCREVKALLADAQEDRVDAFSAAAGRRSRRRIAEVAGLSFARVQQLIRASSRR